MAVYKVRSKAESYGHDVGILLIDCRTPFIPGDVGNASSYGYPVLYRTVPDVTLERLIEKGDLSLTEKVIEEARMLEAFGVTAITSDCGYMMHFQEQVAAAVKIPARIPVHVAGLETCPNFRGPILDETDTLDSDLIEAEVAATAEALCRDHPEIGAILLECSNLPPYAHAVQTRTGRPVFDFLTMIDFVRSAGRRKPFSGNY